MIAFETVLKRTTNIEVFSCALRGEYCPERQPGSYVAAEYKVHGTISCLSVSGRSYKLMCKQLQHLAQSTE